MKKKITNILLGLCTLVILAQVSIAGTVTFTLSSAKVGGIIIVPSTDWQYTVPGIRVKILSNGMPGVGDELGLAWFAQTDQNYRGEYLVELYGKFCVDSSCADGVMGGKITAGNNGLVWTLPPPAISLSASDGNILLLTGVTNSTQGRSWNSTIDLSVTGDKYKPTAIPEPIPEPTTLSLLGLGLLGLARRLRRK